MANRAKGNLSPVLHLPLKKEWYNMIDSGEKTEEYRTVKHYWKKRLQCCAMIPTAESCICCAFGSCKTLVTACFHYGYTNKTMAFYINKIEIGKGRPEWGAPDEDVYIIRLGKRIK